MHMQQYLQAVMYYTPINAMTKPFHGGVFTGCDCAFHGKEVDDSEDVDEVRYEKRG